MTAARRAFLAGLLSTAALAGCREATREQQIAAVSHAGAAAEARARETRWFETGDRELILQAGIGALQDLGFTIEESDGATGVLVGTKLKGARLRAQVTVRRLPGGGRTAMRATFQRIQDRPGAMLSVGETLTDPAIYQGFFEKAAQSAFLTAHDV